MVHLALLILHITGAVATAATVVYTLRILWRERLEWYRRCALALFVLVVFQLGTGIAVYLLSENASLFILCRNFALYLTIPITLVIILALRMRKSKSVVQSINLNSRKIFS